MLGTVCNSIGFDTSLIRSINIKWENTIIDIKSVCMLQKQSYSSHAQFGHTALIAILLRPPIQHKSFQKKLLKFACLFEAETLHRLFHYNVMIYAHTRQAMQNNMNEFQTYFNMVVKMMRNQAAKVSISMPFAVKFSCVNLSVGYSITFLG